MKKSYYSMLNKLVRQMKTDGQYVIDRQTIEDNIDLSEENREDLETMCKGFIACSMLHYNNYKSFVKGQGVFIDTDALRSKKLADRLVSNTDLDVKQKKAALQRLEKIAQDLPDDDYSQMSFDEDMIVFEEMSKEELIEIIRELQEAL